jgi:hypothetical protein
MLPKLQSVGEAGWSPLGLNNVSKQTRGKKPLHHYTPLGLNPNPRKYNNEKD